MHFFLIFLCGILLVWCKGNDTMKKSDERTRDKLEQLSMTLGGFEEEVKEEDKVCKEYGSPFKTSEVIILLFLTCLVSLLMGGLISYRISYKSSKSIDNELKEFIENYDYVVNNYYDKVDKTKLVDSAIAGMLTSLDKNSSYVGTDSDNFNIYLEGNYKGIGIEITLNDKEEIVIHKVFKDSPADKAGLVDGDILVKIAGEDLKGKETGEISKIIKSQGKKFDIEFLRNGERKKTSVEVSDISLDSIFSKIIEKDDKKIGYIRISIFANNTTEQFKNHLSKLEKDGIDSLIIDLRDNSGGHLTTAEGIISLFLDSTHPIYQINSKGKISKYYSRGKKDKDLKVVLLVNGGSASASEVLTSALSEQMGSVIVGEKTYGKGSVQELQTLPSGGKYKLTTKTWLTSKGKTVDKEGIKPDVEVSLDKDYLDDPKDEKDNQLQKAIMEAIK